MDEEDTEEVKLWEDCVVTEETKYKDKVLNNHRFPALLGTMTHKMLEIMVSTKNNFVVEQIVDEIIREYRTPLIQPFEKELTAVLQNVVNRMLQGGYPQNNDSSEDILKMLFEADEVYCKEGKWYIMMNVRLRIFGR